jgi:acyl-coenzyme A synthetase/AMP-(fatty) acid ligase/acyl carrier protein
VIADLQNLSLAAETAGNRRLMNIEAVEPSSAFARLRCAADPAAFACIVYTSGSTGEPKAVILNHRNMLHQASLFVAAYHICIEDRIALLTAGTSNSVHNALLALVAGAALLPFDVRRNGVDRLAEWFAAEEISICMMSSPLFRSLCEACTAKNFPALRLLRLRSEAVYKSDFELYKKHLPKHCILTVGLASSETGMLRNGFFDHDSRISGNEVPVGYAVADKEVWLEDADGRRLGLNAIGEIVVRSKYLSPGYWRRPDLTEAKFKSDPEGGEKRICLTGDLGMMLADGYLVHKGRKDFRVKVRGYRVELAEVEQALLSYPGVREAVVVAAKNKAGESGLTAYFTSQKDQRPAVNELRRFLEQKLPSFMSPSVIIALDSLPLTRNGKVDRSALPALDGSRPDLSTAFLAPRNPTEERLAGIWSDVLGLDCVGVTDNFFELGGHSLAAARIISRLIKAFQLELPIGALFQSPTVRDMAAVIMQNQNSVASQHYLSQVLNELDKLSEFEATQLLNAESRKK